jgi:hypothetical protein
MASGGRVPGLVASAPISIRRGRSGRLEHGLAEDDGALLIGSFGANTGQTHDEPNGLSAACVGSAQGVLLSRMLGSHKMSGWAAPRLPTQLTRSIGIPGSRRLLTLGQTKRAAGETNRVVAYPGHQVVSQSRKCH